MGKKDKKSKAADKKARVAAKVSKKADKKTTKKGGKKNPQDSDSDDQDIDTILEEYAQKQAQHMAIHESPPLDSPPPVRSNALLIASPSDGKELFLFSGELFQGNPPTAKFFNDLYVYHTERNEWREITSGNSPMPRSGAAISCGGQGKGELWLFGGEFSSPKQGVFYHYADFWRLDTEKREWQRIDEKGGPSGRSGHRMTFWKNYIIIFGGFQATSPTTTKYLNDLYLFDCNTHKWTSPPLPAGHVPYPPARSSFSFLPHELGAVIYGGYSRVKGTAKGAQTKKSRPTAAAKTKDVPVHHIDTWLLKIDSGDVGKSRWERRKKPGNIPNPPRVGVTMTHHRGRGVMYGGVYDEEHSEEGLESKFFDDMWLWNIVPNRFWEAKLRKSKRAGGAQKEGAMSRRDRAKADELELLKNLQLLESAHSMEQSETAEAIAAASKEEEKEEVKAEIEFSLTMPQMRFNAAMAVQNDVLYIYGGTLEKGEAEITYDDMYRIDLGKLDGCGKIWARENAVAGEEKEESDDDDDDDDDEDDEEDDSEEESEEDEEDEEEKPKKFTESKRKPKAIDTVIESEKIPEPDNPITEPDSEPVFNFPIPLPFESLREYALRTTQFYQQEVVDGGAANMSVKEVRKVAFEKAEERWWEAREEVRAREEELEELGVGEGGGVVMMTGEQQQQQQGAGRRR